MDNKNEQFDFYNCKTELIGACGKIVSTLISQAVISNSILDATQFIKDYKSIKDNSNILSFFIKDVEISNRFKSFEGVDEINKIGEKYFRLKQKIKDGVTDLFGLIKNDKNGIALQNALRIYLSVCFAYNDKEGYKTLKNATNYIITDLNMQSEFPITSIAN